MRNRAISTPSAIILVVALLVAGLAVGLTIIMSNNNSTIHNTIGTISSSSLSSHSSSSSFPSTLSSSTASTPSDTSSFIGSTTTSLTSSSTISSTSSSFQSTSDTTIGTDSTSSSSGISLSTSSSISTSVSTSTSTTITTGTGYTIMQINDHSRAGYEAALNQGYGLKVVSASWIVPSASCNGGTSNELFSFMWVGIEDFTKIEQIGTRSDCFGSNPTYFAWYEFWPTQANSVTINQVSPGDQIQAQVSYSISTSIYTLTISDQTQRWTKTFSGSGGQNLEPDWIVEAPVDSSGQQYPLADFGSVTFSSCSMTLIHNGQIIMAPITYNDQVFQVTMFDGNTNRILASPSSLSSDGTSFTVTWENSQ